MKKIQVHDQVHVACSRRSCKRTEKLMEGESPFIVKNMCTRVLLLYRYMQSITGCSKMLDKFLNVSAVAIQSFPKLMNLVLSESQASVSYRSRFPEDTSPVLKRELCGWRLLWKQVIIQYASWLRLGIMTDKHVGQTNYRMPPPSA